VTTDTYNMWNLVLQALIWVAMIATFIVYWRQLKAMQHGATGQNILSLVNYLQAENVREARTTVRKNLKGKSFNSWTDDEKLKIKQPDVWTFGFMPFSHLGIPI
jgi:hypothetical protein